MVRPPSSLYLSPSRRFTPRPPLAAEKRVEDATFGMKNKNKSKKVQAFVKSVQSSVKAAMDSKLKAGKTPEQLELEKLRKFVGPLAAPPPPRFFTCLPPPPPSPSHPSPPPPE